MVDRGWHGGSLASAVDAPASIRLWSRPPGSRKRSSSPTGS
jgi:hypothetical protein